MVKKILLTGDDGYRSLGTRLLINALADQYDLTVVGTKTQQSAVGGKMSLKEGFEWGEDEVDGVPAIWVSGAPADGMEFSATYFKKPFDLIISGINWGANLGSVFSSGTVNASLRGLSAQVAPKSIAISWDLPPETYLMDHNEEELLAEYIEYPGKILPGLIDLIVQNNFWNNQLINVNLPQKSTRKIKLSSMELNSKLAYDYAKHQLYDGQGNKHFSYTGHRLKNPKLVKHSDINTVNQGIISITPCRALVDDLATLEKLKYPEISL